jgi:hypothetical protein
MKKLLFAAAALLVFALVWFTDARACQPPAPTLWAMFYDGEPQRWRFKSEQECQEGRVSTGLLDAVCRSIDRDARAGCDEAVYPKNTTYTLWAWFYDPDGWAIYEDGLTLEQCNEDREHFHFRGGAMWRQAEDKDIEKHRPYCAPSGKRRDAEPIGWMKTSDIGCSEIEGKTHCNALDHYTDAYQRGEMCATYGVPFYDRPNGKPMGLIWGEAQIVLGEKSKDGKYTRVWSPPGTKKEALGIMPYSVKSLRGCG